MARSSVLVKQNSTYPLKLKIQSIGLTDDQFLRLCADNRDLRLELTAKGELVIMPPTGSETGWRNVKISQRLANWAEADDTGLPFDSSTGFTLPDGAMRAPDASWVKRERWEALTREQRAVFAPLCPDFVIELRSPSDSLSDVQEKMLEYIENGARLGWLIDPRERRVHIYRPGQPVESLRNPESISGEAVLPGFVFNVREIFT